jgi:hypothetical protein
MKLAYCRDCKIAIAAGPLAPQRTVVVQGKQKVVTTMPSHLVDGECHRNVGLIDVPDQPIPAGDEMDKFLKSLTKKYKAEFDR